MTTQTPTFADTIRYRLPGGRIITVARDLCRAASTLGYQLADGKIVVAVILPGQR